MGSDLPGGLTESSRAGPDGVRRRSAHRGPRHDVTSCWSRCLLVLAVVIAVARTPHPANFVYMALVVGSVLGGRRCGADDRGAQWPPGRAPRTAGTCPHRGGAPRRRLSQRLGDGHPGGRRASRPAAERPAAQTLADVERHGRQTLIELRRLLGVLRIDDRAPLQAPQPGIGDLDRAGRTSTAAADLRVELQVQGATRGQSTGWCVIAVYRCHPGVEITNARKHSPAREEGRSHSALGHPGFSRWRSPTPVHLVVLTPPVPGSGVGLRVMAGQARRAVGGHAGGGSPRSRVVSAPGCRRCPLAEGPA